MLYCSNANIVWGENTERQARFHLNAKGCPWQAMILFTEFTLYLWCQGHKSNLLQVHLSSIIGDFMTRSRTDHSHLPIFKPLPASTFRSELSKTAFELPETQPTFIPKPPNFRRRSEISEEPRACLRWGNIINNACRSCLTSPRTR